MGRFRSNFQSLRALSLVTLPRPFLAVLLLVGLCGCASSGSSGHSSTGGGGTGGGGGSAPGEFLYSANPGSSNISGFQVNSDGSLAILNGFPLTTAQNPRSLAAGGKYLVLANGLDNNGNNGQIVLFDFDSSNGKLRQTSSYATSPNYVAIAPSGNFAYDSESGIAAYSTTGGQLTPLATSPYFYGVAANGNVSPLTPDRLLIDPSGKFLYASFYPASFRIPYGYFGVAPINADGSLGIFPAGSPAQSCNIAGGLAVDPTASGNTFVYESCGDPNFDTSFHIVEFTVDDVTGAITANTSFMGTAGTGGLAAGLAVDVTRKWLIGLDVNNDLMYVLAIDPTTGTLIKAHTFMTGHRPNSVTFDTSGKFLYVSNGDYPWYMTGGDNTVSAFAFDPSSGTATPLPGSPYPAGVSATSLTVAR